VKICIYPLTEHFVTALRLILFLLTFLQCVDVLNAGPKQLILSKKIHRDTRSLSASCSDEMKLISRKQVRGSCTVPQLIWGNDMKNLLNMQRGLWEMLEIIHITCQAKHFFISNVH